MKVLVNAASIKEGGSSVVLTKLIPAMRALRPDIDWVIAAPPHLLAVIGEERVTVLPVTLRGNDMVRVLSWYEMQLPSVIAKLRPDVLFSLTNYLPRRIGCPSMLLEHHVGHFSPEFERLYLAGGPSFYARFAWRRKQAWVRRSLKAADTVTVQTEALASLIAREGVRPRNEIAVIPHGPGIVEHAASSPFSDVDAGLRIGFVTQWGVQKNFDTLFRAVQELDRAGVKITLVLTLNPDHGPAATALARANEIGIALRIENHGEVAPENIQDLYDSLDIFVFPSLCESFGLPMVEAMARGLPIVVAETPENCEVTGSAALRFPARDPSALAAILRDLIADAALRKRQGELSLRRGREFSWQKAAELTLARLDQTALARPRQYDHRAA